MSQKPETVFRQKFQARLKQIDQAWFESIQQKAIAGTPDIIGCVNGYFVALELKATSKDKPTKLQELKLSRIAEANGMAVVVNPDNADHVIDMLIHLSRRKR